jgi:hypothetical protein
VIVWVVVGQDLGHLVTDFLALAPGNTVSCGPGSGVAVSTALNLIATSCRSPNSVLLVECRPPFDERARVALVDGEPFRFRTADSTSSGWLCFRPRPHPRPPTLLVTDAGNDRVVEVHLCPESSRVVSSSGFSVPGGPRGVAASLGLIAVSCCGGDGVPHRIQLFDATEPPLPLRAFTTCGDRPLSFPCGVALAAHCVAVADRRNQRIVIFPLSDATPAAEVHVQFSPMDVALCDNSWLVAGGTGRRVVHVPHGFDPPSSELCLGRGGRHPGCIECASSVAVWPGVGILVRDEAAGHFQVFRR